MPLLGAFGNASEYAYRGFAGLFPDPFDFVDLSNVEPGNVYYSNFSKITGLKIPFPIQIDPTTNRQYSVFASVFGNGNSESVSWADNTDNFSFSDDLDTSLRFISNPSKVKDNQSVVLKLTIPSYSGSPAIEDADTLFGETFQTNVSIGNSIQDWLVTVRDLDRTVNPFTFTNVSNSIAGVAVTTNQVIISGLEDGFNYPAEILTNNANLTIDSVGVGTSGRVENGSVITLDTTSSTSYSDTKTVNFRVSGFTTSWQVTTEPLDLEPTFRYFEGSSVAALAVNNSLTSFTNVTGALFSTQYTTGLTRGLIEAVEIGGLNVGLTTNFTVTGGEAQLIRKNNSGIYTILNPYGAGPLSVKNEDLVSLRTTSSANGSTTTNVDFAVGTGTGQWRVTTQAAAAAPPPGGGGGGPSPITFRTISRRRNADIDRNFYGHGSAISGQITVTTTAGPTIDYPTDSVIFKGDSFYGNNGGVAAVTNQVIGGTQYPRSYNLFPIRIYNTSFAGGTVTTIGGNPASFSQSILGSQVDAGNANGSSKYNFVTYIFINSSNDGTTFVASANYNYTLNNYQPVSGGSFRLATSDPGNGAERMYVLYNNSVEDHLVSFSNTEGTSQGYELIQELGWGVRGGKSQPSGYIALYRILKSDGSHVCTIDAGEKNTLVNDGGTLEGNVGNGVFAWVAGSA